MLDLESPRWSQAVNLCWLLLVLGLRPLSKWYGGWELIEAVACLRGFKELWSMSQDQPFIWKSSLSGPVSWVGLSLWESPGCWNSVIQVDGNSDMAPACQVCSCVALWGEGSEKGQWAFPAFLSWRKLFPRSCLDARHFIFSLDDTGIFQAATLVLELRGSMSNSVCMFFKRNCRSFFHWLIPCWVLQPEVVGTYLSATWPEVFPFHRFEYCANREPGIFKSID